MTDVLIVGTDTDAGKTTLALLTLAAFPGRFAYWKPVETGPSDTQRVHDLVPGATVLDPVARFTDPVSPPLAARREGRTVPAPAVVASARPVSSLPLLIETFGSPLSPFTEEELQIDLVRRLAVPTCLVTSSAVGAIGRTLQGLHALRAHGVEVAAVVLLGPHDPHAIEQIALHEPKVGVFAIVPPTTWDPAGVAAAAAGQIATLTALFACFRPRQRDAADLIGRDRLAVWHPYTALVGNDPLPVVAATEEFLTLADGARLIDAISSWWTILHGHRHPVLMRALREATAALDHVLFAGMTHPWAVELAERMLRTAPWSGGRVFFSDNGSTAVEVALKLAYQFWCQRGEPHRTLFVGLEGCYHGDTFGAMAVSRDPVFFGRFEPLLFRTERVPVSASQLDDWLGRHRDQVAAVVVEPLIQGAGGMRMHTPAELRGLFEATRRHGVLFIADEVMTACRTGAVWAHQHAGIVPDLICAAKTLAGGVLSLAATLVGPDIVAAFATADRSRTFFHGHSFTANPLACAVAVANWRLLEQDGWCADSRRIERFWHSHLADLDGQPGVREVRLCGTIAAVELATDSGYLAEVGPQLYRFAIERGVLLRPLGNVLYALPPLCTSEDSLARIAEVMRQAVETFARVPR